MFEVDRYISVVETILHEVKHVHQDIILQYKKTDGVVILNSSLGAFKFFIKIVKDETNVERTMILFEHFDKNRKILYEYSPVERMVYIHALNISSKIAILLNDEAVAIFFKQNYYYSLLSGYNAGLINDKSNSPT